LDSFVEALIIGSLIMYHWHQLFCFFSPVDLCINLRGSLKCNKCDVDTLNKVIKKPYASF
jgi:hypothetical protein